MNCFKYNKYRGLPITLLFVLGLPLVIYEHKLPPVIIIIAVTGAIIWLVVYYTWTIAISSECLSSFYSIFGFTIRTYACLPFSDIDLIKAGPYNSVIVVPKINTGNVNAKTIVIHKNIEKRSELLSEILKSVDENKITKEIWPMSQQDIEHIPPGGRGKAPRP